MQSEGYLFGHRHSLQSASDASAAAQRLVDLITAGFSIHGDSLNVTCCVGISMFPENGLEGEAHVRRADAAMYSAKQKGPNDHNHGCRREVDLYTNAIITPANNASSPVKQLWIDGYFVG
jgi:GGDEF domain-containing protein